MQQGPVYLTDLDINTAYVYTNLTAGAGGGSSNSTNQTASGITVDFTHLGQEGQTSDGRRYRLCTIGGTSTVAPGTLLVAPSAPSNSTGLAIPSSQPANTAFGNAENNSVSALSKGSLSFNVTNGATAVTTDQFAGGYVEVLQTSGTNEGPISYKLAGNTAAAASGTITLYLAEPLNQPQKLVAGTDTVNLVVSPYAAVVSSSTVGNPVGVLTVQAPNSSSVTYAAWLQTKGHCLLNLDATTGGVSLGGELWQSTTTAGDVAPAAPTLTHGTATPIASAWTAAAASSVVPAVLYIP